MKNKYVFFRKHYKAICIANYADDRTAELQAQRLSNELSEAVIVCRYLAKYEPVALFVGDKAEAE